MIENIKNYMNSKKQEMVELQKKLTCVKALAPENGGDGESEKAAVLLDWLKSKGFKNLEVFNAPDSRVSSGVRPSIVATIPGSDASAPVIWVMAHMDVVPTGELSMWETNPWECVEKDGKLFGRGVEDNQQGLLSMTFAALYLLENNITPKNTVKLLFVADEECGSAYGCQWLVENTNLFNKTDMVLIPDGGDPKGETIEIAEKNLMWMKLHVKGKQTHGSRPDTGINACLASNDLALRLHGLEKIFNKKDELFEPDYSTFQPTMHLKNVDGINIIPGDEVFYMDCRILPCYTISEVQAEAEKIISGIEKDYGVKVEFSLAQKSESPATSKDSPVVKLLSSAIEKAHGQKTRCIGIGGGTVGAELRREGIDCVVWSTLNDMAHQPNEYCIIDNMVKDAITLSVVFAG